VREIADSGHRIRSYPRRYIRVQIVQFGGSGNLTPCKKLTSERGLKTMNEWTLNQMNNPMGSRGSVDSCSFMAGHSALWRLLRF
jgi:hypothetical protein